MYQVWKGMMPNFQTFPKAVNGANGKVESAVKELQPPYEPAGGLCYKTLESCWSETSQTRKGLKGKKAPGSKNQKGL